MRKIKIDDVEIEIRGLTGQELLKLRGEGIPLGRFGVDTAKLWADMDLSETTLDRVFEVLLSDEIRAKLTKMENTATIKVWKAILDETYGTSLSENQPISKTLPTFVNPNSLELN